MIDIVGYVGMALVICSFIPKNIVWLRTINICGAILSCIYGFITLTYPTAILNLCLIVINSAQLIVYFIKRKKENG